MPIQVNGVSASRTHGNKPTIQEINCTLPDGSLTLIVGKIGSGKTTLLQAMSGLIPLTGGSVLYDEKNLWSKGRVDKEILLSLGIVFQHPEYQLFAQTVEKEFSYSLRPYRMAPPEREYRIQGTMQRIGLSETMKEQFPLTLSTGYKRRVALGSTFVTEPAWLFLDEPTSGLDHDGAIRVLNSLAPWRKRAKGGIVIATHDLETFLPLADSVIVMEKGGIAAQISKAELLQHSGVVMEPWIGLSGREQVSKEFRQSGFELPGEFLAPEVLADAILNQLENSNPLQSSLQAKPRVSRKKEEKEDEVTQHIPEPADQTLHSKFMTDELLRLLDPRAKWLIYMLISISFFLQKDWWGIGVCAVVALFIVRISGVSMAAIGKGVKPFLYFSFLAMALSGIQVQFASKDLRIDLLRFNLSSVNQTAMQFSILILIMMLGFVLTLTTDTLRMKKSIQQGFSFLRKLRLPVESFAMAVSLLFRFIPVLFKELQRFSMIVKARGKLQGRAGSIPLRSVRAMTIPLLISMMSYAEEVTLAMEARGFKANAVLSSSQQKARWKKYDYLAVGIGIVVSIGLMLF